MVKSNLIVVRCVCVYKIVIDYVTNCNFHHVILLSDRLQIVSKSQPALCQLGWQTYSNITLLHIACIQSDNIITVYFLSIYLIRIDPLTVVVRTNVNVLKEQENESN